MAAYASKDYLAWLMNPRWGQIPSCGPIICRSRDQDIWVGGRHGEIINHLSPTLVFLWSDRQIRRTPPSPVIVCQQLVVMLFSAIGKSSHPCERAFQHVVDPDCAVFPSARKQRRATGIFGPSTCILGLLISRDSLEYKIRHTMRHSCCRTVSRA